MPREAYAKTGVRPIERQILLGRYQTTLTNQIAKLLKDYFALVDLEETLAPMKTSPSAANDA